MNLHVAKYNCTRNPEPGRGYDNWEIIFLDVNFNITEFIIHFN